MKTNGKHEVMARIARQSLVLAALLAMVLSAASISRAQSSAASTAAPAAKPTVAPAKAPALHAAKGQHEGIKVHGHWTIEVKNPDGKVVTHREFENGLFSSPINGGATLLSALLSGVATAGSWEVLLTEANYEDAIIIAQPNSTAFAGCPAYLQLLAGGNRVGSCSNLLQVTGPSLVTAGTILNGFTGNTLTFAGTGTVPQGFGTAIGNVNTQSFLCLPSDTPTVCLSDPTSADITLTYRNLDGQNGDPAPVPVTAGQTVAVTVVISFQ